MAMAAAMLLPVVACRDRTRSAAPEAPEAPEAPVSAPELVTDGPVLAIASAADGTTYVGGSFTRIGPATGHLAVIDGTTGALVSAPEPRLGVAVPELSAASDGSGGWYVGGWMMPAPGARVPALLHVRSDGTIDPSFAPTLDAPPWAIAVSDGTVYLGGPFEHVAGLARQGLAAVDAATGQPTVWSPSVPHLAASDTYAYALAAGGGKIYVAGGYVNGYSTGFVAQVDPDGTVSTWNPHILGAVKALATRDGTLFIGGSFVNVEGEWRYRLAAFDRDGNLSPWNPELNAPVNALVVDGPTLYVGGGFTTIGREDHPYLAAIDPAGTVSSWMPSPSDTVGALAVCGGTLYAGGSFQAIGGAERDRAAAFHPSGALLAWDPGATGPVTQIACGGANVLLAGDFTGVGGARRSGLAAIDPVGHLAPFSPRLECEGCIDATPVVRAIAIDQHRVFAGGSFARAGGLPRVNLAAFDPGGNLLAATPPVDGAVQALAILGDRVYVGGTFRNAGGQARVGLAAFDPAAGGSVLGWDPALADTPSGPAEVRALVTDGARLLVGGRFGLAQGAIRHSTAAFDAGGQLLAWTADVDASEPWSRVNALAAAGGQVYVGGVFPRLGGEARDGLGAVDAATGAPTPWNPAVPSERGWRTAILPVDGTVYIAGRVQSQFGPDRGYLAAVDAASGIADPLTWIDGALNTFGLRGDRILLGGWFRNIAERPRSGIDTLPR